MKTFSSTWALLFLIPFAVAGPVAPNGCVSECRIPVNAKFQHAIAKTYVYDYQAASLTSMLGTSEDKAALNINGQALVTFRDRCNVELSLRKTSIDGLNEKIDVSELEARPIMLSWQDGAVESVCAHSAEPAWAANIKRAVASMLQHTPQFLEVSQENIVESDIIGRCPTNYTVGQSEDLITVVKSKLPNQCSNRVERHSSIPSVAYLVPAEIQSIPLFDSSSVCTQKIKAGVIQGVTCEEEHTFRPLSSENGGGAKTVVSTSLAFVAVEDAVAAKPAAELQSSDLFFDASALRFEQLNAKNVNSIVRSICQTLASDNQVLVSQYFTELVYSLRRASPKEVKDAYNSAKSKKVCPEAAKTEKLFLDALPQAGTVGTITLMADLLKKNEIPSRQAAAWYLSLPLAKYATVEAIKPFIPMIESISESPVGLLGVTGMVRRICSKNVEQCVASKEVVQLSIVIHHLLGNRCQVDAKGEIRVLSALKALGNMGIIANEAQAVINQCAKDINLPIAVRLAAIEAARNNACAQQVRNLHLELLADKNQDNEVRIAAYLSVMRCPSSASLLRVQDILAVEEYNQVGSFIISHMNNLESSKSPAHEHARRLVKKLNLNRSFPKDLRKYSRNLASTYFCNQHNVGWELDANVVYSAKSFMPRSASFNMSVDLFGHSFNLFEFGARAENLERILEAYLGPDGSVQKEGIAESLKKASSAINEMADNIAESASNAIRAKRALIKSSEVNALEKTISMKDKESVKIDAFLRVFGAEIAMYNYRGVSGQKKLGLLEGIQSRVTDALRDLIQGAQKVNIDIARSMMFLDSSLTFPTVAGLPVRLAVNGTTTVALGLENQMDIGSILRDPRNAVIKMKLSPLAVTEVAAAMTVDIGVAKTGVKMLATIHSSFAADFSAKAVEGSSVDIKLDLPKSKITLIDIKSQVLLVQQNTHKKLAIANEATYSHGGCSERLSAITGMRVCAVSTLSVPRPLSDISKDPAPSFPLSGNAAFSIVIEKTDASMKGYSFLLNTKQSGANTKTVSLVIDTPGSQVSRKLSFKGTLTTQPTLAARLEAKAPWGQVVVEGQLINEPTVKAVEMKIISADREYFGRLQTVISRESGVAFLTTVEGQWPGQPRAIVLEGQLARVPGSMLKLSLKPAGPLANLPFAVDVHIARNVMPNARLITIPQLEIVTPFGTLVLSGDIGRMDKTFLITAAIKYGTEKQHESKIDLRATEVATSPAEIIAYSTTLSTLSSRFPAMDMTIGWDMLVSTTTISNTLNAKRGESTLYIKQHSSRAGKIARDYSLVNQLEVVYPKYNINIKFNQDLKFDNRNIKAIAQLSVSEKELLNADISLIFAPADSNNVYELNIMITTPRRSIMLSDTGRVIAPNTFSISPVLELTPGGKHQLIGQASFLRSSEELNWSIDSELTIEGMTTPMKVHHLVRIARSKSIVTSTMVERNGEKRFALDATINKMEEAISVDMAAFLINRIDGKIVATIARKAGQLDMDLNLIRLERRIKLSSSRKIEAGKGYASVSVAWDADKDASKQVSLEINASLPPRALDLESIVTVLGNRYALNVNAKVGQKVSESLEVSAALEHPSGQKTILNLATTNMATETGMTNLVTLETTLTTGALYHLTLKNVLSNVNREAMTFEAATEVVIKSPRVEGITMLFEARRTANTPLRSTMAKLHISAPKFLPPIDASIELSADKESVHAVVAYKGTTTINMETSGKLVLVDTKRTLTGSFELAVPALPFQQIKVSLLSNADIQNIHNFDIKDKLTVQYKDSEPIELEFSTKRDQIAMVFELETMLKTPIATLRRTGLTINGRVVPGAAGTTVEASAVVLMRESKELRLDAEYEESPESRKIKLAVATPFPSFPSAEIRFEGRSSQPGVLEIDTVITVVDRQTKMSIRMDNSRPKTTEFDLTLALPSANPMRLFARVGLQTPYTIEARADWGTSSMTIKGSGKIIGSDNFEITLSCDSPSMEINGYEIQIINRPVDKRRRMELVMKKQSASVFNAKAIYDVKESKNGVEIKGNAEVNAAEPIISVKYAILKSLIEKSEESGVEYKLKLDIVSLPESSTLKLSKIESGLKITNKEKTIMVSLANKENVITELTCGLKNKSTASTVSHELVAMLKKKSPSAEVARGLRIKYLSAGVKFEHSTDLIFDEVKGHVMGYKIYRKDGEHGLEISTPKRVIGVALEKVKGAKLFSKHVLSVWLDKANAADNRLTISTSMEPHKLQDMDGFLTAVEIRHPSLPRDIVYKVDFHTGSRQSLFHIKLDMDVFDAEHKRFILESNIKSTPIDKVNKNVTIETVFHSVGTDLGAMLVLHGSVAESDVALGANLKMMEGDSIAKELFINVNSNKETAMLRMGSPSKTIAFESRFDFDEVVGHRRVLVTASSQILALPVMSMIFDVNTMPHVDIRVFNKATPENYYVISGGLLEDSKFEMVMARQVGSTKRDLFGAYVTLNTTELLHSRLTWDVESIREFLQIAHTRVLSVRSEIRSSLEVLARELSVIAGKWRAFDSFKTDSAAFIAEYSQQMSQLIADIKSDDSFSDAVALVKVVRTYVAMVVENVRVIRIRLAESDLFNKIKAFVAANIEKMAEILRELSSAVSEIIDRLIHRWESLKSKLSDSRAVLQYVKEIIAAYQAKIKEISEKYQLTWIERINKILSWYRSQDIMEGALKMYAQQIVSFLDESFFASAEEILNAITAKYPETSRFVYRNINVPMKKVQTYVRELNVPTAKIAKNVNEAKEAMSTLLGKITVLDLENGEIQYELPLYKEVKSLRELKSLLNLPSIEIKSLSTSSKYATVADMVSRVRANYSPRFFQSRMRGYASLIGSTGYITFDKKFYHMSGNCQYLLARDFLQKDFTVAVNYEQQSKESVKKTIIFADLEDQVEIRNKDVWINNKVAKQLPATLKSITVQRDGDIITIARSHGAVLRCNVEADTCSFEVSPFYQGRIMGLWGTFSNEVADEFVLPNGKMAKELSNFATNWKLNKSCKDNMVASAEPISKTESSEAVETCKMNFHEESSKLRPCFGVVSTTSYYDLCVKSEKNAIKAGNKMAGVTSAANAYIAACERFGVSLPAF